MSPCERVDLNNSIISAHESSRFYNCLARRHVERLTATANPRMRKEPNASFGREAFGLEQHLRQARRKRVGAHSGGWTTNRSCLLLQTQEAGSDFSLVLSEHSSCLQIEFRSTNDRIWAVTHQANALRGHNDEEWGSSRTFFVSG
jgi:hypothetical protein